MKTILCFLAAILWLNIAGASELTTLGSKDFGYVGIKSIRALRQAGIPQVQATAATPSETDINQLHLQPLCGNNVLLGYAKTAAQFTEAVSLWTGILSRAGIQAGQPTFENGIYLLPYKTPDGAIIRRFLAEPRQFKPKDDESLLANMDMVLAEMQKRNIPVIAHSAIKLEGLLPTYSIYYLTPRKENPSQETMVRILGNGESIDFDILENAGIDIIQKPRPWLMVYIGREIGFGSRVARTQADAEKKLQERVAYLISAGKTIIGSRIIHFSTDPSVEYPYLINIYFYQ